MPNPNGPLRYRVRPELRPALAQRRNTVVPEVNTLGILVSMRCNAACRHCAFRSHPGRTETIDLQHAKEIIDQAQAACPELIMVSFSGGEPFLDFGLLEALIAHTHSRDLYSAVVTNSSWAHSEQRARSVLEPLCSQGLIDLTSSLDQYHRPFVPPAHVSNAVAAAQALGMRAHVNVAVGNAGDFRAEDVPRILRLDGEHFRGPDAITVTEFTSTPVGFARNAREACAAPLASDRDYPACLSILRAPAVNPKGEVFACCGVGGATDLGPGPLFRIGSTHNASFGELMQQMQSNLLYGLIAGLGPAGLLERAFWACGKRPFDPGALCGSPCNACHLLHTDVRAQRAVASFLASIKDGTGRPAAAARFSATRERRTP